MKKIIFFPLLFFGISYFSLSLGASLQFGNASYAGSGCPGGTVSMTQSPDGSYLSIIFDQFIAQASSTGRGNNWDYKNCVLNIPIQVPSGYQATIYHIDYRGYVFAPSPGGMAKVQIRYIFSRRRGLVYTRVFPGGFDDLYVFSNNLEQRSIVWTSCGESTSLNIDAQLQARANNQGQPGIATIDTADVAAGLRYHFLLRPCS